MVKVAVVVHPQGLGPTEAAKAWYMRVVEKMKWTDIQKKVKNVQGKTPLSEHCVKNAVQRQTAAGKKGALPTSSSSHVSVTATREGNPNAWR